MWGTTGSARPNRPRARTRLRLYDERRPGLQRVIRLRASAATDSHGDSPFRVWAACRRQSSGDGRGDWSAAGAWVCVGNGAGLGRREHVERSACRLWIHARHPARCVVGVSRARDVGLTRMADRGSSGRSPPTNHSGPPDHQPSRPSAADAPSHTENRRELYAAPPAGDPRR
jgi:hypothetical protein